MNIRESAGLLLCALLSKGHPITNGNVLCCCRIDHRVPIIPMFFGMPNVPLTDP
jgi:hypothetical protein